MERRHSIRRSIGKTVTLLLQGGNPVTGKTIDISDEGMCLEVASVFGIPERFRVRLDDRERPLAVQVVWREPRRLGVAFLDEASPTG